MGKAKKANLGAEHRKKFPFPEITDSGLSYGGVTVPLEGGHRMLFGLFSARMTIAENGWISQASPFTHVLEMQAGAQYKSEPIAREAIAKLNRKLKKFEEVGLKMHIGGDYRRYFRLRLSYKK